MNFIRTAITVLFLSAWVGAQTTAPTSQPSLSALAQQIITVAQQQQAAAVQQQAAADQAVIAGLQQQLAALTLPADPPDPPLAKTDFDLYVSPSLGNDANAGTSAAPLQTAAKAYALAKSNSQAGKFTTIHLSATEAIEGWWDYLTNNISVDGSWIPAALATTQPATPATGPPPRCTLLVHGNTFVGNNVHHVHLRSLILKPFSGPGTANTEVAGFWANGGDDISFDRCLIDGFRGIGVDLPGGITNVRIYRCWIGNTFDPNLSTETCSGLYTECVAPDVECNTFYHNGWKNSVANPNDPANAAERWAMVFRHGWYENPASGAATVGTDKFNLYLRNASIGHQGRVGGHKMLWNVYWDNGSACDAFCGAGWNSNLPGEIGNFACFGNLTPDFYNWGGGVAGQSVSDYIHDGLFAGSASTQLDSPVTIQWTGGNGAQGVPLPANTTATVKKCKGWWPVMPAVNIQSGRTATVNAVNIVPAPAGVHVPTLADYFGFTGTDQQNEAAIALKLQNPEPQQAQKIIAWLAGQLPQ